jgi:ferredoxin-NADP reductase
VVAYLCGNPGMIAAAETRLRALGLPAEAIVTERYWASEQAAA